MLGTFFTVIQQDPLISQVKLIAEPWDVGQGGYQVGKFPPGWAEWNGKYRDTARNYWRGENSTLGEFAFRFTGSADLYATNGRQPVASVNFVTAHDGFTLLDLVSYNEKHNDANGEENRDGESHNRSWNSGVEGPTEDPEVNELRDRQRRNLLATLILSQGVPMLLHGDELGRTQLGNNNAYCQDNEISWVQWEQADESLLEFTRQLIHFMKAHPVFKQRRWFQGRPIRGLGLGDIGWFRPDAEEMKEEDWGETLAKSLAVFLNGKGIQAPDEFGNRVADDSFYLMFNAHHEPVKFKLPPTPLFPRWVKVLDTTQPALEQSGKAYEAGRTVTVAGRSLVVFCHDS
jgi:glycogen operon protein